MSHECDVAEVRAVVNEWRTKAMTVVVLVVALIGLPMFFVAVLRDGLHLSWNLRAAVAAAFLMVVLAGWRHGWSLEVRALMFFTGVYSISAIQLGTTGLVGSGRIGLMLFPLLALVLVGNRGGWLAAGVSLILFAGATGLTAGGVLEQSHLALDYSTNPAFWSLQGTMMLAALVPLMFLFARFQDLQMRLMNQERTARREVECAVAERRRLEDEITRVSDEEQRRIGSELHDGLCQQLTAALLECTAVGNTLESHGSKEAGAVRRLGVVLEDCIGSAYDAAKGLCPVELDPGSLVPALQRLGRKLPKAGIKCEVRETGRTPALSPQAVHHLYRIAQEAVTNAVKHARCRRIEVELHTSAQTCTLRVVDDGQGQRPRDGQKSGGMGTQIMNYRAKAMGGSLRVDHPDTGGTIVMCQVPCGEAAMPT
jgi:signal transduction histidine kinase